MSEEERNNQEIEQAIGYLESQKVDVKKLAEERKAMKERLNKIEPTRLVPSIMAVYIQSSPAKK